MTAKLYGLTDRFEEVTVLLADRDVMNDRNKFTALSKEYAELDPVIQTFKSVEKLEQDIQLINRWVYRPGAPLDLTPPYLRQ